MRYRYRPAEPEQRRAFRGIAEARLGSAAATPGDEHPGIVHMSLWQEYTRRLAGALDEETTRPAADRGDLQVESVIERPGLHAGSPPESCAIAHEHEPSLGHDECATDGRQDPLDALAWFKMLDQGGSRSVRQAIHQDWPGGSHPGHAASQVRWDRGADREDPVFAMLSIRHRAPLAPGFE
jgi:hypothetical protein